MTKSFLFVSGSSMAALALCALEGGFSFGVAAEPVPTSQDVENARRCAADTRAAGYAFREVRDSVRAGGTTRAQALLTAADDALMGARSSCRDNPEVTADLEILAAEAEELRRALSAAPR